MAAARVHARRAEPVVFAVKVEGRVDAVRRRDSERGASFTFLQCNFAFCSERTVHGTYRFSRG